MTVHNLTVPQSINSLTKLKQKMTKILLITISGLQIAMMKMRK